MLVFVRLAAADDIRVMTSGTFTAAYLELRPQLERSLKVKIVTTATAMGVGSDSIPSRLERGETVDVVIVADDALNQLIKSGRVLADSRVELARSAIGMAVRKGAPKPDISSVDALKRTLLQAKSIAYSASVSGQYLTTELFPRLGVADQVMSKSRRIDRERVGAVVGRGEAEIGFQQISELLPEAGIDVVGPLPPAVQRVTVVSAGVAASSKSADAARALIRFLASSEAAGAVKASGLEPMASMGARQSAPTSRSNATTAIDKVLADAVARGDVPGVVAMVTDRRGIVYQGAFGVADVSSGRPMAVDTMFRIASMTKPVTSLAVMQLVEQGRLSLDDPAEKYLPQLANLKVFETFDAKTGAYTLRPAKRAPTVRQLLTHTAGFGYSFTSPIVRDFKPRAGEAYAAGPLLFDPGEQWLYSTGIDWGGRIVESLSGKKLETYFHDHIFMPLGMTETAYNPPDDRRPRLTVVHRRRSDGTFEADPVQPAWFVPQPVGGGGLASTASDYIRFLQMLLNQGALNGTRIVSAETVATMSRNHIGGVGVRAVKTAMPERSSDFTFVEDGRDKWGIGFMITANGRPGRRSAGSLSWGGLNNTYFWIDPARGIGGVILMQFLPFADSKALALYDAFEQAVYADRW
jgi:CubicO group peptidase (beta-lactamase class C family)